MNFLPSQLISECRSCQSTELVKSINLGEMGSCGAFRENLDSETPSGVLQILICSNCLLVQLDRNFDLDELFRIEYGYESSLNASMAKHLYQLFDEAVLSVNTNEKCNYLDIGSNDATLVNYATKSRRFDQIFAVDPTIERFYSNYDSSIEKFPDFFTSELASIISSTGANFQLITSIAMFYDLPNPNDFIAGIKQLLAPEGVWILELSYLYSMIQAVAFDTICHEHLEYYSLRSLSKLVDKHKLQIVSVELNESNGGSMRVSVTHDNASFAPTDLTPFLAQEKGTAGEISVLLENMMQSVEDNLNCANDLLMLAKLNGSTVHGLGASTKGNTFLQYANWGIQELPYIAEVNEKKFNKYTPSTDIPIISEANSISMNPDYYLVLPWHFRQNIIKRQQEFLNLGGKLIFVFPKFEVVESKN
jgi:hypothetical protein